MSDVIEGSLEELELDGEVEVIEIVRNNQKVLIAVGVLGLAVGAAAGYFYAKRQLKAFYEDIATQEIEEAKEFYANVNKVSLDGDPLTPQDVLQQRHPEAAAAMREYQGRVEVDVEDEELLAKTESSVRVSKAPQVEVYTSSAEEDIEEIQGRSDQINVFEDVTFDLTEEKKYRTEEAPYIITHDEYFESEKNYEQVSLTYFELDNVLVNENDRPIENVDERVGGDNLVRFGAGSKDKNIVYIRNDAREIDYEITRSTGSYLEEVLGMPDEEPGSLKHSDRRDERRAFRRGEG